MKRSSKPKPKILEHWKTNRENFKDRIKEEKR
jgi:hypothetical protein